MTRGRPRTGAGLLLAVVLAGCRSSEQPAAPAAAPSSTEPLAPLAPASGGAGGLAAAAVDAGERAAADASSGADALAGAPEAPCSGPGSLPRLENDAGELFYCPAGGPPRALSAGGGSSHASLSPDGAWVVYMRHAGKQEIKIGGAGDESIAIDDDRVMLVAVAGGEPVEVARNSEAARCLSLSEPRFADAELVVVSAYGYGFPSYHNRSVCAVDLRTRTIHHLGARTTCALYLTAGRFKGAFFVSALGFTLGLGPYDMFLVVDRRGRVLKRFVDTPFAVDLDGDGVVSQDEQFPGCPDRPPLPRGPLEALMKKL